MEAVCEDLELFKKSVADTFKRFHYGIQPRPPYVLIRIIPKERSLDLGNNLRIILPDVKGKEQNKPLYEGQVLVTYKPYWKKFRGIVGSEGTPAEMEIYTKSELNPGDHVLFPHFEGVPVPFLCNDWKRGEYRLVKDECIYGVVEYKRQSVQQRLIDLIYTESGQAYSDAAINILDQADVIFHEQAKTLSGK